jgi:integrase
MGVRAPSIGRLGRNVTFLASREVTLDEPSRTMFLDYLYSDFAAAMRLLISRARGDYSPDEYPRQFPQFARTPDPGLTPWMLFERWIEALKPASSTVDRWRGVFLQLTKDFPGQNVNSFTPEQARAWLNGLTSSVRTAATVKGTWLNAAKTVWRWALEQRLVASNPFAIRLPVPRRIWTRESKAFQPDEANTILCAALAVADVSRKSAAAKRWIPWLCAYTGARSGEVAQLRGTDVLERGGVSAIRITPEGGTVKSRQTRVVPIHEHLIEQGFLGFVERSGKGPLFYNEGGLSRRRPDQSPQTSVCEDKRASSRVGERVGCGRPGAAAQPCLAPSSRLRREAALASAFPMRLPAMHHIRSPVATALLR